jgi:arsenate reductase-like glutaredoxin family protein
VDFKFVDGNGVVVATADSAGEAKAMLQAEHTLLDRHILLDDTGVEISRAELDIFCSVEPSGAKPYA